MLRPARLLLVALAALAGCVPDGLTDYDWGALQPPPPPPAPDGPAVVGTFDLGGAALVLTAERGGLHLGHNHVRLTGPGGAAPGRTLVLAATALDGTAAGTAMPAATVASDGSAGLWLLATDGAASRRFTLRVEDDAGASAALDAEARPDLWMQVGARADGTPRVVSWVTPVRARVGANTLTVAVHDWIGGAFVPADHLTVALEPWMDMGGGDGHSTPFSAPVGVGGGRYTSTVDFVMSGRWQMGVAAGLLGEAPARVLFDGYTVYDP